MLKDAKLLLIDGQFLMYTVGPKFTLRAIDDILKFATEMS